MTQRPNNWKTKSINGVDFEQGKQILLEIS